MVLFVSDLDGTLLNDSSVIKPATIDALNRLIEEGVHFTIATARAYPSIRTILDGLDLVLPIIEQNGALVRDYASGHVIAAKLMRQKSVIDVCATFDHHGAFPLISVLNGDENCVLQGEINNAGMEWAITSMQKANKPRRLVGYDTMDTTDPSFVLQYRYLGPEQEIKAIADHITAAHPDLSITLFHNFYTDGWEINISSVEANKGDALKDLRPHAKGISKVVVFGDNDNDIDMFHHADESYAVSNATDAARSKATATIGRNTDDAVIRFIEAQVLAAVPA